MLLWLPVPLGSNRLWSNGLLIALTGALCFAWALLHWCNQRPLSLPLRKGLPLLFLLMLAQAWVAAQLLFGWSLNTGETQVHLLLGLSYTLLFAMVLDLFDTRSGLNRLLMTLIISGTLQAFYGAAMTLSGLEWGFLGGKEHYRGVATGTFVNRNHLAGYLELSLACGVGLLLASHSRRQFSWHSLLELIAGPKTLIRLALVIMVIALVMTHSRMGNVAFFSSLLISGTILALRNKEHRLRSGLILGSLIVIDILIISQYFGLQELQQRLVTTQLEDRFEGGDLVARENVDRDDVAAYALALLERYPLTGTGAGSFEAVFPAQAGPDIRIHFDHAHNDYLQFAIEYGAVGFGLLGLFVMLALYHCLRVLWRAESTYRSGVGLAGCMGLLALLIHSIADFNLQIPANAATFVVIATFGLLARFHQRNT